MTNKELVILVADDDSVIRMMVSKTLSVQCYSVIEAKDGMEAIDVYRQADPSPHLIITDYEMPGCNGLELARTIGNDCPYFDE